MNSHPASRNAATLPPKALLISLLAQLPLNLLFWPPRLEIPWILAGVALFLAGALLNIWSDQLFRRHNVGVCPFSPAPTLLETGPYRWSRNPMYLGLVCIAAGPAIFTTVFWNLIAAAALLVWLHFRYVLAEEAFLRESFTTAFLEYAAARPRWLGLPGPSRQLHTAGSR